MKIFKQLFTLSSIIFFLIIAANFIPKVQAATVKTGENITLAKNQTINDNLFTSGNDLVINSDVKGDIFCAGQTVKINGNVEGDVICAAQEIIINGRINGSVRVAAESVIIAGRVMQNVMVFAKSLSVKSSIGKELFVGAQDLNMQGSVGQNLNGEVETASITGNVRQNVNLEATTISLGENAKVGGDLNYKSQHPANIVRTSSVKGKVNYEELSKKEDTDKTFGAEWVGEKIFSILSSLVIALLMVLLWPKNVVSIIESIKNKPLGSLGFGLLVMFVTPIVALILLITLIGIPLSILLLIFWGIAMYFSRIFVGIFIGKKLLESYWKLKKDSIVWSTILGVIITWIAFATPFIGGILSFVAVLIGLGGIFYVIRPARKEKVIVKKK